MFMMFMISKLRIANGVCHHTSKGVGKVVILRTMPFVFVEVVRSSPTCVRDRVSMCALPPGPLALRYTCCA